LLTGLAASVVAPVAIAELIRKGFAAALDGGKETVDEWLQRRRSPGSSTCRSALANYSKGWPGIWSYCSNIWRLRNYGVSRAGC